MFVPWLVFGFVPDPEAEEVEDDWPSQPIALEWLDSADADLADIDRAYIEAACRSPLSVFAVEEVTPGRSLDLKDVLTGARFHVLEQGGTRNLRRADLLFTRVVTVEGTSLMLGAAPFIVPPHWHTTIIDWREELCRARLMTRQDLEDFDIEIRNLYFETVEEILNPTPPRLQNTDGDPLALTTLTFRLTMPVPEVFERLLPLATIGGEQHLSDVAEDASGAVTEATLSWVKAGNQQHKGWRNTILGTLRLEADRLVADVNSDRRAKRLTREIARRVGQGAVLIESIVTDHTEALRAKAGVSPAARPHEAEGERPPQLQALEAEMRRTHWRQWLDTRVPALGNKTPRQAARTVSGRERLEALLATFDRQAIIEGGDAAREIAVLRDELGLGKPAG